MRGWRFTMGDDAFPPQWRSERWRGVWIRRYAFPNMELDGSDREPPGGWSENAGNVHFAMRSKDGTARQIGWKGAGPNDPDRQDLLLVDDLSTKSGFGDPATRRAVIRDLHALHPRPWRRAVIYATRDPADALEVAVRLAVLRQGRIVQCGTPSEIRHEPPKPVRGAALPAVSRYFASGCGRTWNLTAFCSVPGPPSRCHAA